MKSILVIDDASFILESTRTLLNFEGYDVITAKDGVEGLEMAVNKKPDLILCDISMPRLDGYGVLKAIRENPLTARIPFIFLTAFTERQNIRIGMQLGADDFLVKPYSRDELITSIDAQLQKSSLQEKVLEEKVQEVSKSVTQVLPHEFRTVLNQIMGSAKFLQNNPEKLMSNEVKELATDILDSAKRLLKITENYIIYSRIETIASSKDKTNQLLLQKSMEPAAMLYDITAFVSVRYNRTNDLIVDAPINNLSIQISTESFHKIIEELTDNAFKFSNVGDEVKVVGKINDNKFIVDIIDKGRGMSRQQIDNIGALMQFERDVFEQQGVGLGLIIAKKLTELHNGVFKIESYEGQGTTVTLEFPYQYEE
jgi:signal transduction histidine kinase